MDTVPDAELNSAISEIPILQWSGQRRIKYFLTGVIGPISCFAMVWCGFNARVNSLWKDGTLDTYLTLMLESQPLLPFMPLLVFSMLCLSACCFDPRLGRKRWVRVGVYGGGILSAQYLLFVTIAGSFVPFLCAAVVGPFLALVTYIAAQLLPQARRITIYQIMLLTTVVAVLAAICVWFAPTINRDGMRDVVAFTLAGLFWMVVAVPVLNCITYVRATFALVRSPALGKVISNDQGKLLALAFGWLFGFGASWKFSLDAMLAEYAKLPSSQPKCYVSAAAACGHPRFVGVACFSRLEPKTERDLTFPLNLQMCRLKFLELALAALSPTLHRLTRRVYDVVGPRAAAACRSNVWFADVSFIALKPVEFLAWVVQVLFRVPSSEVRELYSLHRSR